MNKPNTIHFDRLERFLKVKPNLFQEILKLITENNEKEGSRLQVWMDFSVNILRILEMILS